MTAPAAAFYARADGTGGWRDWLTLLHPPYTAWHLSYVAIGAAIAPHFVGWKLGYSVLAFFLAIGVSAHALDELRGRPLRTGIPASVLLAAATVSGVGAVALGVLAGVHMIPFIAVGVVLLVGYNLELFGGALHNDVTFAAAWGGFPVLTGYYAQHFTLGLSAWIAAVSAFALSWAQRTLSTPARKLRRRTTAVRGTLVHTDGTEEALDAATLLAPLEKALRALAIASCALAAALVAARL